MSNTAHFFRHCFIYLFCDILFWIFSERKWRIAICETTNNTVRASHRYDRMMTARISKQPCTSGVPSGGLNENLRTGRNFLNVLDQIVTSSSEVNDSRFWFDVYGSMHHKYIPIYIQQDATSHSLLISGNCSTRFGVLLPPIFKSVYNWFERAVGGVHHPQHAQTSSNFSTIAAGSSNGVTNTRRCRYSCMCSWWWVEATPETCRAVSRYK
jgi:hypothetical protein